MPGVWIVTGATRGLGRAIVDSALDAGHSVVATTRSGRLENVGSGLAHRLLVHQLDVTDPSDGAFTAVAEAAVERFGGIDILVNNAGHGSRVFFEDSDDDQVRQIFETNVFGLMKMTRVVLPVMRQQRSGHVFNISSIAGYMGASVLYSTTKFAVTGFTEALAEELRPFGITATNVAPGLFRTDILDPSSDPGPAADPKADYAAAREQRDALISLFNHTQPGDPAALGRLLVEVANSGCPPLHLPVGADAIDGIERHRHRLMTDVDTWREKTAATAHAPN